MSQVGDYGALLQLITIDATVIGGEVLRFVKGPLDSEPVSFDGEEYLPLPIEVTRIVKSTQLTKPELKASNVGAQFLPILTNTNNLIGANVYIIRVYQAHLADPSKAAQPLEFYIDQLKQQDKKYIRWNMRAMIDRADLQIPRRQVLRDTCTYIYRRYVNSTDNFSYEKVTCPYTNPNYFDENNNPSHKFADSCSHTLNGCRVRFGAAGNIPFGGFPGTARTREDV